MPEPRRYSRKQQASVVAMAAASSVKAAAIESGIPRSTIRDWIKQPEYAALLEATRQDLAEEFRALAHMATARLVELLPDMKARDVVILASMSVDKAQLLSGGATSRTETRDLTGVIEDDEWDRVQAWLREAADAVGD